MLEWFCGGNLKKKHEDFLMCKVIQRRMRENLNETQLRRNEAGRKKRVRDWYMTFHHEVVSAVDI